MGGTEGVGLTPTGTDGVGNGVTETGGKLGEGRAGGLTAGADGTGNDGSGVGDGRPSTIFT
jgi:hypothetical protein